MYLAKPVVYLAICSVFEFCVVCLAIFVLYLAKPHQLNTYMRKCY